MGQDKNLSNSDDNQTKKTYGKDTTAYCWFLTVNNPEKYLTDKYKIDARDLTPEDVLRTYLEMWTCKKDGSYRDNRGAYGCYEIGGVTGTPHLHLALYNALGNGTRFSTVQKIFSWAHIERGGRTIRAIRDYIAKEGAKHEDKKETQVVPLQVSGMPLPKEMLDKPLSSKSNVMDEIDTLLMAGKTPKEIIAMGIRYARYADKIRELYAVKKEAEIPVKRQVKVVYHTGDTGTGKTECYAKYCEELGRKEIGAKDPGESDETYKIRCQNAGAKYIYFCDAGDDKNPFDNYQYEPILWIDELRGSSFSRGQLLSILNGTPCHLKARYHSPLLAATEIHISTIIPPEDLYFSLKNKDEITAEMEAKNRDTKEQLLRRISYIQHHYIDPFRDGDDKYQSFTVDGLIYKSYDELKIIEHAKVAETRKARERGEQLSISLDPVTQAEIDAITTEWEAPF